MAEIVPLLKISLSALSHGALPPSNVLQLLVSKVLGYCILAGACFTKVPQISNVVKAKSAEGLSAISFELETLGFLVHASYGLVMGLAFNTYGESIILLAQNLLLVGLIYKYAKMPAIRGVTALSLLVALAGVVLSGHVDKALVKTVYEANNILFMAARLPQIVKNYREKSTGQLSLITNAINLLGCVIRIFTSLSEGAGGAMVRAFLIGGALNTVLVAQILMYQKKPQPKAKVT